MVTGAKPKRRMIQRSRGKVIYYDCSNCTWYFEFSVQVDPPMGQTEKEQRKIHEAERDKRFQEHDCSKYPRPKAK